MPTIRPDDGPALLAAFRKHGATPTLNPHGWIVWGNLTGVPSSLLRLGGNVALNAMRCALADETADELTAERARANGCVTGAVGQAGPRPPAPPLPLDAPQPPPPPSPQCAPQTVPAERAKGPARASPRRATPKKAAGGQGALF